MSTKGERKKIKSLNAPKAVHIHRKEDTWTVKTKAGAHNKESSVALGIVLRNFIGLAKNLKEAKMILGNGDVKVNGKIRKAYQFSVGVFDVISIQKQKAFFRVLLDAKGRIILHDMKKDSNEKFSRVEKKKATKKGIQITTNDGLTIMDAKASVGDTLKITVPTGTVSEVYPLENGAPVYVIKGIHCSEQGKIVEIIPGRANRSKLVKIEQDGKEYSTTAQNVIVVGKNKVEVEELK